MKELFGIKFIIIMSLTIIKVLGAKPISWIFGAIAWLQKRKWPITRKRKELELWNHAASDIIRLFRSLWSGYWALYLFSNQSYSYFKSAQIDAIGTREKVALPLKLNFRLFFGDYWDYNLQLKAEKPLFTGCFIIMQDLTGLVITVGKNVFPFFEATVFWSSDH